jgi:hypothetical protein
MQNSAYAGKVQATEVPQTERAQGFACRRQPGFAPGMQTDYQLSV